MRKELRAYLYPIATTLIMFVALSQTVPFLEAQTKIAAPMGVVLAFDQDSGVGIDTVSKTTWSNHNGFTPYGPLYYRLTQLFIQRDLLQTTDGFKENVEARQQSQHFLLMAVSFLSVIGTAYLIGFTLGPSLFQKILLGSGTLWCLLWLNQITDQAFRSKPDLLQAFLITLGLVTAIFTVNSFDRKSETRRGVFSAFIWGCAVCTKVTAALYLAALMPLFFYRPDRGFIFREGVIKATIFGLIAIVTYFCIGYPQSLDFHGVLSQISYMKKFMTEPTLASTQFIINQFGTKFWLIAGCITLCSAIFSERRESLLRVRKTQLTLIFLVPIIPTLYLAKNTLNFPSEHYFIPIFLTFFIAFLTAGQVLGAPLMRVLPSPVRSMVRTAVQAIILLLLIKSPLPWSVRAELSEKAANGCFEEAKNISQDLSRLIKDGHHLGISPYVPVDGSIAGPHNFRQFTVLTIPELREFTAISVNKVYYNRYLEKPLSHYVRVDFPSNTEGFVSFFETLDQMKPFIDTDGRAWSLQKISHCGWQIWVTALTQKQLSNK